MTQAFPLHWPEHWPKTPPHKRARSKFDTPLVTARDELLRELRLMGATHIVISSYLQLRQDGLPYANQRQPDDPAVAVWFYWRGEQRCIPCDRWDRVQDNINAIRHTVAAMRGVERWGTGEMLKRTAHVFDALPPPDASRHWHQVLGVSPHATESEIRAAYRQRATQWHPDHPDGDPDRMKELNAARDEALRHVRAA